jgi:hypothetical protein
MGFTSASMKNVEVNKRNELICNMRWAGVTLREIGEKTGISKQRVSQILAQNPGLTQHSLLSTQQLCDISGLPKNRLVTLQKQGFIKPASTWSVGERTYLLWSSSVPEEIAACYRMHWVCQFCGRLLPKRRIRFCSDACYIEKHKYKNMTPKEKRKVRDRVRHFRERKQ